MLFFDCVLRRGPTQFFTTRRKEQLKASHIIPSKHNMSVAAAERLNPEQLCADETLSECYTDSYYESTGSVKAAAPVVTSRTAILDPVLMTDGRVLKEMLDREDRGRETAVMVTGYESRSTDLRLYMRCTVVNWMFEVRNLHIVHPFIEETNVSVVNSFSHRHLYYRMHK